MKQAISKIVFTGPESTAKSTLAKDLARAHNLPLVEEYARAYLNTTNMQYQKDDLDNIAKMQVYKEYVAQQGQSLIVCDTDILTIKVWSDKKYKNTSFHVNSMIKSNDWSNKIYLLCYPDTEWVADPQRESPFERDELFDMYKRFLLKHKADFFVVDGLGPQRYELVEEILKRESVLG